MMWAAWLAGIVLVAVVGQLHERRQRASAEQALRQARGLRWESAANRQEAKEIMRRADFRFEQALAILNAQPVLIREGALLLCTKGNGPFRVTGYTVRHTREGGGQLTLHGIDPVAWDNYQTALGAEATKER
jgi:hypothetical protein